jgi:choline dehydrogenase
MKRAEHFYPPSKETLAKGAYFAPAAHGYTGHVGVSFVQPYRGWVLSEALTAAAQKVFGLKGGDVTGGDPNVATQIALSVHPAGNTSARSSSAASYLYPLFAPHSNTTHQHPGLTVVPGVQATRIRWAAAGVTTGVEYGAANGRGPRMTVRAHKEVLVCAGAIGSPALLLRSGVGAPAELAKFNITSVIDLPSVGTNVRSASIKRTMCSNSDPRCSCRTRHSPSCSTT